MIACIEDGYVLFATEFELRLPGFSLAAMTTVMRRFLGLAGGVLLGTALGDAADKAGITPNNDGDMAVYGIVAGLGFGLTVLARVRGDER